MLITVILVVAGNVTERGRYNSRETGNHLRIREKELLYVVNRRGRTFYTLLGLEEQHGERVSALLLQFGLHALNGCLEEKVNQEPVGSFCADMLQA